jgi:hypothetical protein
VSDDPAARTRTLARIVGPYLVVVGLALATRGDALTQLLPAFMQDKPLTFATGAFTLTAGLVMVAAHHHWSSLAAIAVSLIGVAAALKGAWLMIAPGMGAQLTAAVANAPPALMIAAALQILVGLWLSFAGWFARKNAAA